MSSPEGSQQKGDISGFLRRYTDNVWTNIGRERDGVAPEDVQQSVALRPPDHVTSYVRLAGSSNKGITNSGQCTLFYLVLEGEINFVIENSLLVAKKGDNFYVPPNTNFTLINLSEKTAELYLFQYKYTVKKNKDIL